MKIMEIYKNGSKKVKNYIYNKYSVRTYYPYTKEEIYSDRDEVLQKFINNSNKEEFVELSGDGSDAIVYIWNTDATEEDIKMHKEHNRCIHYYLKKSEKIKSEESFLINEIHFLVTVNDGDEDKARAYAASIGEELAGGYVVDECLSEYQAQKDVFYKCPEDIEPLKDEKRDLIMDIISYELDEMNDNEIIQFFQKLINNGLVWSLQGHYGRTARDLIAGGYCVEA